MQTDRVEVRLATGGTYKIKARPVAEGYHEIHVNFVFLTATAISTVAFADGTKTVTFDVGAGMPTAFDKGLVFKGDADITITNTGGTTTVIFDVSYKK